MEQRISKENYYLNIAETVLERATCLRRVFGAIIVKNDEIISTGYNGAPRGRCNCVDMGFCTREAMKVPRGERQQRVREALERVGLTKRARHLPTELSGGQQQRVAIARALVTRPSLILADEPTGNLDSKTSQEIMDMFHELHRQGNTIVLITHDPGVAKQAERAIHILDGRITEATL